MAMDCSLGIFGTKLDEEIAKSGLLCRCSCILAMVAAISTFLCLTSSDVTDADGFVVVTSAMCADLVLRATYMHTAVAVNHVMITNRHKSSGLMPSGDVSDSVILAFGSCRAMDDEFGC